MKILHVFSGIYNNGGLPVEVRTLIKTQINQGDRVFILTEGKNVTDNNQLYGVESVNLTSGNIFNQIGYIKNIVKSISPDYIHIYSGWLLLNFITWLAIKNCNIPYIITLHGMLIPYILEKRFGGRTNFPFFKHLKMIYQLLIDYPIVKGATIIHCLSAYEQNLVAKKFRAKKTFIAPFGVECSLNDDSEIVKKDITQILFIGRLDIYQKGLDIILESVRNMNLKGLKTKFQIDFIGPSINNSKDKLNNYLVRNNITNVRLKGSITGKDKEDLFGRYKFLLLPSRYEGLAKVVREAITRKMPVIASKESNFGDWVSSYNMGICVDGLDTVSLECALTKAINLNDTEYNQLRENTQKWIYDYTWDNISFKIKDEVSKLANAKSRSK